MGEENTGDAISIIALERWSAAFCGGFFVCFGGGICKLLKIFQWRYRFV